MALLMLILQMVAGSARAEPTASALQPWNVELGAGVGFAHGSEGLPEGFTGRALFSVQFGYHWDQWYVGLATRGAFSNAAPTRIQTSQTVVTGKLTHREIEYGLVARRYIAGRQWYAQAGAGLTYNEAITEDQALYAAPVGYFNRFYVDGTWLQGAIGHEFKDTPWFARLEYTYEFFYSGKAIRTEQGINEIIEKQNLTDRPHAHVVTLVVGLANLF